MVVYMPVQDEGPAPTEHGRGDVGTWAVRGAEEGQDVTRPGGNSQFGANQDRRSRSRIKTEYMYVCVLGGERDREN